MAIETHDRALTDPTSPFGNHEGFGFGRDGRLHGLLAFVRPEDR